MMGSQGLPEVVKRSRKEYGGVTGSYGELRESREVTGSHRESRGVTGTQGDSCKHVIKVVS